jgi:DNA-binding CsgD family transcriptional regulator
MPGTDDVRLPPQLAPVLARLLEGESEKQVADRLGISPHTVNRHVQRLYRRFGVHSRGELMSRCRNGHSGQPER